VLVCAQVRAHVEQHIGLIADGKAQKEAVVAHTLEQFRAKFMFFVGHITRMDALFEASFSPLASSGEWRVLTLVAKHLNIGVIGNLRFQGVLGFGMCECGCIPRVMRCACATVCITLCSQLWVTVHTCKQTAR
jgi:hypothetical protein